MKSSGWIAFFMIVGAIFSSVTVSGSDIRPPAVSGAFYPSDPEKLEKTIRMFLADSPVPGKDRPIALVSPHAGYVYSGQIAADAFRQAKGGDYDLVVLLGPNHTVAPFSGAAVWAKGGFETPLGICAVDEKAAAGLIGLDPHIEADVGPHEREHSLEVQVPFVQVLFPEAKILPVIFGKPDPAYCVRFGEILAGFLKNRKALIVASSDLSHYPAYKDAAREDLLTLSAIKDSPPEKLGSRIRGLKTGNVPGLSTRACGLSPIIAASAAARKLGARCTGIVSYANSGDSLSGSLDRVVGYGAAVFSGSGDCEKPVLLPVTKNRDQRIGPRQKARLLEIARKTIEGFMYCGMPPLARGVDPVLRSMQGAFVTLTKDGRLRGCIGHMAEDTPLSHVVGKMALNAAFDDPRFPPLTPGELEKIRIEISVLTPMRKVKGPEEIRVGTDGVLIRKNGRQAVFLPQVATEQGWNREEMLDRLCRKAGLMPGDWKKGAVFLTFQALVFHEPNHSG